MSHQKVSHTIEEFREATGIGRSRAYEEIKLGRLIPRKCGRRTLITVSEMEAWLEQLSRPSTQDHVDLRV